MVFEKKIEEHNIKIFKPSSKTKVRLDLEPKREFELQKIIKAYGTVKKLSRTKLIKMAIDNLIINIEEQASDLEPKRENELQKINKVYSKEVYFNEKKIGRTKIIKMAIDNLIADLEKLPEEEAVEYVRTLYKEAEF